MASASVLKPRYYHVKLHVRSIATLKQPAVRIQTPTCRHFHASTSSSTSSSSSSSSRPDEGLATSIRSLMRSSAQPVAVITTLLPDEDGVHGATLSSFTTVSLDPPLVAFSIRTPSRLAEALSYHSSSAETAHFAINILSSTQVDVAKSFAKPGLEACPLRTLRAEPSTDIPKTAHPLTRSRTTLSKHVKSIQGKSIPVLTDSVGALSCSLVHRLDLRKAFATASSQAEDGSSDLFVARIHAVEDLGDTTSERRKPLIYWQRGFSTIEM